MQNKSRILFVIHLPPPIHGASLVGTFIRDSKYIKDNFDCKFLNLATAGNLVDVGKFRFLKILTYIQLLSRIIIEVNKYKYDLCFITLAAKTPAFYKDLIVILILKLFRKRMIFHFHNKGVAKSSQTFFNNYIYRLALKNTPCIQLSKLLYEDIEKYVHKQNVHILPNGIPFGSSLHREETKEKKSLQCNILFLSNMMADKGVYILIAACKLLKDKGTDFKCHFVGDWADVSQEDFDVAVSRSGLQTYLVSHGKKYGEDKYKFYSQSDIFVLPSLNECFPLVLLEAMQFGLPIVSTEEGGIPDIVADGVTGYLVERKDSNKLAEKLQYLIENKEVRLKMGLSANNRFNELFRIEIFEKNLVEILETVLKQEA